MTIKQQFIAEVEDVMQYAEKTFSPEVQEFWEDFKTKNGPKGLSEKTLSIYTWMVDNKELFENVFTAKKIAEGMEIAPRSVSGSMRKLVEEKKIEKIAGSTPAVYKIID